MGPWKGPFDFTLVFGSTIIQMIYYATAHPGFLARRGAWLSGKPFLFFAVGALIPVVASLPPFLCACKRFSLVALGDHVSTCTSYSDAKQARDWAVEQLADLFPTTARVKTSNITTTNVV